MPLTIPVSGRRINGSLFLGIALAAGLAPLWGARATADDVETTALDRKEAARILVDYFESMSAPKRFVVRQGGEFQEHRKHLRRRLLADIGLDPLPERIPLDSRASRAIDHPWCTIRKVTYQVWPDIYTPALLYEPKSLPEKPAPAMLCPHGHWSDGFAYRDVQARCLMFARLGYVTLSPAQNHHEDLNIGLSNQTHMVWTNMRGLDYLESLAAVDGERIGVAGASGGGLQSEMLLALDPRVKAASIVGFTCDFREIMFPHAAHCGCNHFPNVMAYTDHPEISTLGYPAAVQYLTMNDWTGHFRHDNFPAISTFYSSNGQPGAADCSYWPTGHTYDRTKRERTYWWMEKWVRANSSATIPEEPNLIQTVFPENTLGQLTVDNPDDKGLTHLSAIVRKQHRYRNAPMSSRNEWSTYRKDMSDRIRGLLGLDRELPQQNGACERLGTDDSDTFVVERYVYPGEGTICIPVTVLRPRGHDGGPLSVTVILSDIGSALEPDDVEKILGPRQGDRLVVLPDVRFTGSYRLQRLAGLVDPSLGDFQAASPLRRRRSEAEERTSLLWAWERNSVVWGRPLIGMVVSDINAVLAALSKRSDTDLAGIRIVTSGPAHLGVAALFAGILDGRVSSLDVDLNRASFEASRPWHETPDKLPVLPFILRYGDIPQWVAVLADREVTLRNLRAVGEDLAWLRHTFAVVGRADHLRILD